MTLTMYSLPVAKLRIVYLGVVREAETSLVSVFHSLLRKDHATMTRTYADYPLFV